MLSLCKHQYNLTKKYSVGTGFQTHDLSSKIGIGVGPPKLSGFEWSYHPEALGLNPKHTVHAFLFVGSQILY